MTETYTFNRTIYEAATERHVQETVSLTPDQMVKLITPMMRGHQYTTAQMWMQAKRLGEVDRRYENLNLTQDIEEEYEIE